MIALTITVTGLAATNCSKIVLTIVFHAFVTDCRFRIKADSRPREDPFSPKYYNCSP
jgi:hypothetical protein